MPPPFLRQAIALRSEAVTALTDAAADRVVAFHPSAFPGRPARLPSTTIVVDDVYSFTGATHLRRRGVSFDGSVAVASVDHDIAEGYSAKVRDQRIRSMTARLGVAETGTGGLPTAEIMRLQRPAAAFALVRDMVRQGGLGRIQPLWDGPDDTTVIPQSTAVADPDGSDGGTLGLLLAALLGA